MKVRVIRDSAFVMNNGQPASDLLGYDAFAKRYLSDFNEVVLVARLFQKEDSSVSVATGPNVTFEAVPGYHGPMGFLRALPGILRVIFHTIDHDTAYILRVPSTVPSLYAFALWVRRIPFAVEVAADPLDGYSKKSLNDHPFAGFFQKCFVEMTAWQCRTAAVSAYVTKHALQKRYPPRPDAPTFAFTSIDLAPEAYLTQPRNANSFNQSMPHIVLVGNMQKSLKGHDVLLKALKILADEGQKSRLTIVGHGENKERYAKMAAELGLNVTFTGRVSNGAPIRSILDSADIFVLPSRQEGLPRALLEAMARGLPCIATRVGGTPELLPSEALVESEDSLGMANRLKALLANPAIMAQQSARNLEVARTYDAETVRQVRRSFYKTIISITAGKKGS